MLNEHGNDFGSVSQAAMALCTMLARLGRALSMLTQALAGCIPLAGDGAQEHQEAFLPLAKKDAWIFPKEVAVGRLLAK